MGSTNHRLLATASRLAPCGTELRIYQGVGDLPHYRPEADVEPLPPEVAQLRSIVGEADGLIISCPEYAGGIPGAFKNALDWLVGGDEMYEKRVAIWRASTRGESATASLKLVLSTLASRIVDEHIFGSWPRGRSASCDDLMHDGAFAGEIRAAFARCLGAMNRRP